MLENVKQINDGPVLIHVVTQKGKGYPPAEASADKLHAVVKFDVVTGQQMKAAVSNAPQYTKVFANELIKHAERDEKIIGITAAMPSGTGLDVFAKRFPDRTFDVGIAEQHAVTFAAGLAADGMKPFAAIYSTFLQRGYDQVVHDVAIQGLPVRFAIDRAGLVGADGATHAGSFDVGYLGQLPGFVIMAAADEAELAHMISTSVAIDDRPSAFRFPRGEGVGVTVPDLAEPLEIGKGRIVREGTAVAILSFGTRLAESLKAADMLAARGLSATVADARFAKPLDVDLILRLAREHEALVTVEEGAIGRLRRLRAARPGRARRPGPGPEGAHPHPARHLPGPGQARGDVRRRGAGRGGYRPRRPRGARARAGVQRPSRLSSGAPKSRLRGGGAVAEDPRPLRVPVGPSGARSRLTAPGGRG